MLHSYAMRVMIILPPVCIPFTLRSIGGKQVVTVSLGCLETLAVSLGLRKRS